MKTITKNIVEYFYGLIGQVTAGLPILFITSIIAHNMGLEEAGKFTILVGLSSTLYTLSLWGFRPLIILDRLETFGYKIFFISRFILFIIFSIVLVLFCIINNYSIELGLIILCYKISDGFIDLNFAFNQLKNSFVSLKRYGIQHLFKFLLFILVYLLLYFSILDNLYLSILIVGFITLIIITKRLFDDGGIVINDSQITFKEIIQLLKKSSVFVMNASICALLTGIPRFSLGQFYDGEYLGIIGVSLSVGTLFGMVFHTTWLRYFAKYRKNIDLFNFGLKYIIENILIAILLFLISLYVLPYLMSIFFDFDYKQYKDITQIMLLGCIIFNLGMSIANLYKITNFPWIESLVYILALSAGILYAFLDHSNVETYQLLFTSGILMFFTGSISLIFFKIDGK